MSVPVGSSRPVLFHSSPFEATGSVLWDYRGTSSLRRQPSITRTRPLFVGIGLGRSNRFRRGMEWRWRWGRRMGGFAQAQIGRRYSQPVARIARCNAGPCCGRLQGELSVEGDGLFPADRGRLRMKGFLPPGRSRPRRPRLLGRGGFLPVRHRFSGRDLCSRGAQWARNGPRRRRR